MLSTPRLALIAGLLVACGGSSDGAAAGGEGGAGAGAAGPTTSMHASTGAHPASSTTTTTTTGHTATSSSGGHGGDTQASNGPGPTSTGVGGASNTTTTTAGTGGAGPASSSASTGGGSATGQWVLGYYVGYSIDDYPIAQIDWSGITHIAFSPMTLKADLSLDLSFSDSHGTGPADAMALSAAAHQHGVVPVLMLGGEGAGARIATAASSAHRAAFVTALLQGIDQLGYDGIDLDWEDSVNLDDLVSLAQDLRAARPSIVLTYPGGAINGNFQTVDARFVTLAAALDQFNVQTYYPSTAFAGQGWDSWFSSPISGVSGSTPIAIDDTLQRYHAAGIPNAKLGFGMAFYAICYTGGITGPRQSTNGTSQQIVGGDNNYPLSAFFDAGSTFASSSAGEQQRDATAQVPFLALANAVNDGHCGGSTRYITYDDETSIVAKGAFSKTNGYGGMIIWTLEEGWLKQGSTGGRAPNALMQALKTGFLTP
jgi:chitinase